MRARWISGEDPARLHRALHGVIDEDLPPWIECAPGESLQLPADAWTWLCAELSSGGRTWTHYRRFAPGTDPWTLVLREQADPTVWILGFDALLDGPARGATVDARTPDGRIEQTVLDERGFGSISIRSPGVVTLGTRAAGSPTASEKHIKRVLLGAVTPFDAHVITLVAPEPEFKVGLRVHAIGAQAIFDASRLALRRTDRDGALFPLTARVIEGLSEAVMSLPRGSYVPESVPAGAFAVTVGDGILHVDGEVTGVPIRIEAGGRQTELELRGLAIRDCPIRVRALAIDAIVGASAELEFIGPFHWQRMRERVSCVPGEVEIEVVGRSGSWISELPVRLDSSPVVANMRAARRIEFTWLDGPPSASALVLAASAAGRGSARLVHLTRKLVNWAGVDRPAWVANLTVHAGEASVECVDATGRTVWSTALIGEASVTRIWIEGPDARALHTW